MTLDTGLILPAIAAERVTHNDFMAGFRRLASFVSTVLLILTSAFVPLSNSVSARPASSTASARSEQLPAEYASALLAANHFLQAWQSGDAETGVALLTSHAKKAVTTDGVERFFSSPDPSAYEIGRGKLVHGRYDFPVVLVSVDAKNNHARRRFSTIVVLHSGGNDWVVDKLP